MRYKVDSVRRARNAALAAMWAAVMLGGCGEPIHEAREPLKASSSQPVVPLALGGPVILGGDDLTDHGSYNSSTGQVETGWLYIRKALESLSSRVTRPNDGTVAVLGAADATTTCCNAGAAYHYATPLAGLTPRFYNGVAGLEAFFDDLRAGNVNPAIIVASGTGAQNNLDSQEGVVLSNNAVTMADFVNSGGGLMSHGSGPVAYGWLATLLPGIVEANGCTSSSLSLTPEGQAAFPGLTNSHIRSGPCHSNFSGNLGNLLVLARDGSQRNIILGGAAVQLPGSITLQPQSVTYVIGVTSAHTVTATVQNGSLEPIVGATVTFTVDSGPNAGSTGTAVTNASGSASFTYNSNGLPGTDQVTASFVDGETVRTAPAVQAIWEQPPNLPPDAIPGGPYSTPEGSSVSLDASASSDPDGDALTFAWDLDGDGAHDDATGPTASFFGVDGPATHTVGLSVCDPYACDTAAVTVTVLNVAPTASAGADQTVYRNASVSLSGTFTDPAGAADDPYAWSWDLDGDGAPDASGSTSFDSAIPGSASFAAAGTYTLTLRVTDKDGGTHSDTVVITVLNRPPDCSAAAPSISRLWPPNHQMVSVSLLGITDPDNDSLTITITSLRQDEPVDNIADGHTGPDGAGVGTSTAEVRAERSGSPRNPGNGRVYHIGFSASDGALSCTGTVTVGVPHDQGGQPIPVDDGPLYDSTVP